MSPSVSLLLACLQHGLRDKSTITYNTPLGVIFGVKKYADSLMKVVQRKDIKVNFKCKILEVRGDKKEAVFEVLDNGTQEVYKVISVCVWVWCVIDFHFQYDMMHAVPPMGPLDVMKGSPLCDQLGWVDVNKETLQHVRYRTMASLPPPPHNDLSVHITLPPPITHLQLMCLH